MSDENENNQPPPAQEETPVEKDAAPVDEGTPAVADEEKPAAEEEQPAAAEEKPAEEKPAEEKPAEEKPAEEKPAEEKPAEGAAGTDAAKPADDEAPPAEDAPANDNDEQPAEDAQPAAAKEEPAAKEEEPAKEETPAKEEPAAKEEEPAKEETPAKDEPAAKEEKRRPSVSAQSETSTSRRRSSAVAADPFEGLSAAERVRLGYAMAQKRFAQRRPSAGMASNTPRDPYRPLVKSATVTPQMQRRQEVEEARKAHFAHKSGYEAGKMLPPSSFDSSKPNKDPKRSSSWTRDRTTRRPFAPSYDYVPSSRQVPTPGPGAYRDPLANYVGM